MLWQNIVILKLPYWHCIFPVDGGSRTDRGWTERCQLFQSFHQTPLERAHGWRLKRVGRAIRPAAGPAAAKATIAAVMPEGDSDP